MLEVAEADLDLEAGFVHVKGAPGMPHIARRACPIGSPKYPFAVLMGQKSFEKLTFDDSSP
jgi:hypothetical protein